MVRIGSKPFKGGFGGETLVATKYVISAAHCFLQTNELGIIIQVSKPSEIVVAIGMDNLKLDDKDEDKPLPTILISVEKITIHKNYTNSHSDLAILMLSSEVDIEQYTPACLARTIDEGTFYNKKAWIAGWGRLEPPIIDIHGNEINPPNSKPDQVQEVRIPVKQCPIDHDHPTLLCGQYLQGRKSPCKVK